WIIGKANNLSIFRWMEGQIAKYYELKGVVEILNPEQVNIAWDAEALTYKPQTQNQTFIFRRKK
ncbi:MAG: hypothetical protein NTX03_04920, partial [Bacteroidetes bacterium]|nr:hypothetical protein [Bacteroidota bacterium]